MIMGVNVRLSDEEFLQLPDAPGKQELLDGELISLPPAIQRHNAIARRFYELLLNALHPSRVWHEIGYFMGPGNWLQPDVSVIWPDQRKGQWYEGSPMIAIEVLSPSNTKDKVRRKTVSYLGGGALEVWVVDTDLVTMQVYSKDGIQQIAGIYQCASVPVTVDLHELVF